MGVFPSAPDVAVRAPTAIFAGEACTVEIVIDARQPTKIEFVDARLVGTQGWAVGAGRQRVSHQATDLDQRLRLRDEGELPAGETRLVGRFAIPHGLPPSHDRAPAWARLELRVQVSIPWWPDGRYRFPLALRIRPPDVVERAPIALRTEGGAGDRRLELALASTRLVVGERLVGSAALFHVGDDKPREVQLKLVPKLALYGRGRIRERDAKGIKWTHVIPEGSAGTSVPFAIDLPADLTPSYAASCHALRWILVASHDSFFRDRLSLSIPLDIVDHSALATVERLAITPRLADERVAAAFDGFAAKHAWQRAETADEREDGTVAIEREHGDSRLRIAYVYRGKDGTFAETRVSYPSLGLGLNAGPGSTLRHVFFRDVESGIDDWDRAHVVSARSTVQTEPVLRAMVEPIATSRALGAITLWDDDAIRFEREIVSIEATDLLAMSADLHQVANAIARGRPTIGPPSEIATDRAAWTGLARWLDGNLCLGDLSIDGELAGVPVAIELQFSDATPIRFRVHVGESSPSSVSLSLPRPAADGLSVAAAAPILDQLVAWPDDITDLVVADGVAAASLAISPSIDHVARLRELVASLRRIVSTLVPSLGPYR
jgi:hypothetical protein